VRSVLSGSVACRRGFIRSIPIFLCLNAPFNVFSAPYRQRGDVDGVRTVAGDADEEGVAAAGVSERVRRRRIWPSCVLGAGGRAKNSRTRFAILCTSPCHSVSSGRTCECLCSDCHHLAWAD
jgi:hypothetical protein